LKVGEIDLMIIFEVAYLYTKIPIDDSINVIRIDYGENASFVEVCLKSAYFSFSGEIYKQTHGVAMGSCLSPIIDNIYMEDFK